MTDSGCQEGRPLVSILLPVDRSHPYLEVAIRSILNQTYRHFELIVIANGCSDDAWQGLQRFTDCRVMLVRTRLHSLAFALNLGIHVAQGELIARMDSDDISDITRIERQVHHFEVNPSLTVLGTQYDLIDFAGNSIGKGPDLPSTNETIRRRLPFRCALAHPTVMFRKTAIEMIGGYAYASPSEDYDLWLRLSRNKDVVFASIPEALFKYRVHEDQETGIANCVRIFVFDFTLKIRESLLTKRPVLLAGAAYSIIILLGSPILRKLRTKRRPSIAPAERDS
jgi:glycosyltransferase involved in cell wall biosynthesis